MKAMLLFLAAVVFSILIFMYLPYPLVWTSIAWIVVCVAMMLMFRNTTASAILISVMAALFTLGSFETYLLSIEKPEPVAIYGGSVAENYYIYRGTRAKALGYAPKRNAKVESRLFKDETLIYDVKYSINGQGLRVSPDANDDAVCVLFFGGSFTFGEGLNDDQAMPYIVGSLAKGELEIYNFGFHGYGPHQMLSALENGLVDKQIDCKPKYIVYSVIPSHIRRVIGNIGWDKQGPRYVLQADETVQLTGNFSDKEFKKIEQPLLSKILDKSLILSKAYRYFFGIWDVNDPRAKALFTGIVKQAAVFTREHYPDSEFHIVYWDRRGGLKEDLTKKLSAGGTTIHRISDVIPDLVEHSDRYKISGDGHPTEMANQVIAAYLLENVFD